MDASGTAEICAALETIARERLETDRELIRLGAIRGTDAYRAGNVTGRLYAARELVRMHAELINLLQRTRPLLPDGEIAVRVDALLERVHSL